MKFRVFRVFLRCDREIQLHFTLKFVSSILQERSHGPVQRHAVSSIAPAYRVAQRFSVLWFTATPPARVAVLRSRAHVRIVAAKDCHLGSGAQDEGPFVT